MLVHIMDQPELEKGEGPIGIIVAPTRELAEQIHKETRRFSKPYNLRVCAAFGGLSKHDQFKDLKAGAEVRGVHECLFVTSCCNPQICVERHVKIYPVHDLNCRWRSAHLGA